MGYNVKDYIKIRDEFAEKYQVARNIADARRAEIHIAIPEIARIDGVLSRTGLDVMEIAQKGGNVESAVAEIESRNNALIAERRSLLASAGYPEDYTDVHYDCEICGDTGFVDTKMCQCMRRAIMKEGFLSSGLGALIGKQTFDNLELDYYPESSRDMMRTAVDQLKAFAEGFSEDTYVNFIMIGGTGLGKTHLSTAVAQKVIEGGHSVHYVSAVSMIRDFSNSIRRYGEGEPVDVSVYYDCDLLIIDDLGTEVPNRLTQSYFYEVINERINSRKCTIINTNLSPAELQEIYSERVTSRIFGEYSPISFKGVDIRKQKSLK